jgi:carbon monoxide dehydrogenase subunit G
MIETQQKVVIQAGIDCAWNYARDINKWANLMPGLQSCAIMDPDNSKWVLKVGVGGLVRTVTVLVHVDKWDGPERARFTYRLEGDPVEGGGAYTASRRSAGETEVTLTVRVAGSGAMAPMWEAMGGPLLPKFARSFAEQLKAEIEKTTGTGAPPTIETPSLWAIVWRGLQRFCRAPFGSALR